MELRIKKIDINGTEYPLDKNRKIRINKVLNRKGDWTDITLGFDIPYFIELQNLKHSLNPLFRNWYTKVVDHFSKIVKLISDWKIGKLPEEDFRNQLDPLTDKLKEQKGQFFGFGGTWGDGYGMGKKDTKDFLLATDKIVDALFDSTIEIIAEITLFYGANIGQDKINDFITGILFEDLEEYTQTILKTTIGYDQIMVLNGNKEPIKVLLTPFDIVAPKIRQSFDKEFYDEFKPLKNALLNLSNDILRSAFSEKINTKIKDDGKFTKSDIPEILRGLKKIGNKKARDEFINSLLNNNERDSQRRRLKKETNIKEIANKLIETKRLNPENIKFNEIFEYCKDNFSNYSTIASQISNKVFDQVLLTLLKADYIFSYKNYKKNLIEINPTKVVIIRTDKTRQKTIDKKILLIKELNPKIEIFIFNKEK